MLATSNITLERILLHYAPLRGISHRGYSPSFYCEERVTDRHAFSARNSGGSGFSDRKVAPPGRNCVLHDLLGRSRAVALDVAASRGTQATTGVESTKAAAIPSSGSELMRNLKSRFGCL